MTQMFNKDKSWIEKANPNLKFPSKHKKIYKIKNEAVVGVSFKGEIVTIPNRKTHHVFLL